MVGFQHRDDDGKDTKRKKETTSMRPGQRYVVPLAVVALMVIWYVSSGGGGVKEFQGEGGADVKTKFLRNENGTSNSAVIEESVDDVTGDTESTPGYSSECSVVCNDRRSSREEHFGGDLLNRTTLSNLFQAAKTRLYQQLYVQYGKVRFEKIFLNPGPKTTW